MAFFLLLSIRYLCSGNWYNYQVGEWSTPARVYKKANPLLDIGTDPGGRTRLIFRKFDNDKPELVGIVEDSDQKEFRDINRDLYNAVLEPNEDMALDEMEVFLVNGADINARGKKNFTPLELALQIVNNSRITERLLASPNVNVGCVELQFFKKSKNQKIFLQKKDQDEKLFKKVKEAAKEVDENKVDELLKEIKGLLESENKYGFKPSLNYSFKGNGKTTAEIAIEAGGKLLQLLYDYAKENIGVDTKIFKQLKRAKENSQPKRDLCNVSISGHFTQAKGF